MEINSKQLQLNKYLALCGVASRRKASTVIDEGRVVVNGEVVQKQGRVIQLHKDKILFDGNPVLPPDKYRYIIMNKPAGFITSVEDNRGRKTVLDLIDEKIHIFPVGRLDYDTEGVLLLTNDGDLAYRLTHPKFQIDKIYEVWVEGIINDHILNRLRKGVDIGEGINVKGEVKILDQNKRQTKIEICIHEGKKRQIKRMMKAVDCPVIKLRRIKFAGLTIESLDNGIWRDLTLDEVDELYLITGLKTTLSEKD
jgi:23S rRNA pseudouridine2605 synthase